MSEKKQVAVPYFIHEGMMTRMQMAMEKVDNSNKRMRKALLLVCITLVVTVTIFSVAYTENNKNWMNYVEQLQQVEEAANAETVLTEVQQ